MISANQRYDEKLHWAYNFYLWECELIQIARGKDTKVLVFHTSIYCELQWKIKYPVLHKELITSRGYLY